MGRFLFIFNEKNSGSYELAGRLSDYLENRGMQVLHPNGQNAFRICDLGRYQPSAGDIAVVLGGDGTMLAAARILARHLVPMFGVNMGRVGFLTAVESGGAVQALDWVLNGEYHIQERLLLSASVVRDGAEMARCIALNEIYVASGNQSRSVMLDLFIDGESIHSYHADGIIVATPTGSTGYSLSAGGPIVMEEMDVTLVTPVCPHTFFSRPILASADSKVEIINRSGLRAASLTADGQYRFTLEQDDHIFITRAPYRVRLIRFSADSYFERIRNKLYV